MTGGHNSLTTQFQFIEFGVQQKISLWRIPIKGTSECYAQI